VDKDFGGIENLSLIPGNVGASPIQNIGAYGVELEDVFDSCSGIMIDSLDKVNLSKSDCEFTYRSSIFKKKLKNKFIITSVRFNLTKSNHLYNIDYPDLNNLSESRLDLKKISNEVIKIRNSKLPDPKQYGNCGSFFKNPVIGYSKFQKLKEKFTEIPFFKTDSNYFKVPAAWLIDKCGFKKINDKNVGVYKNQPLVVINLGNASGNEIINFAKRIKDSVFNEFDIELEEEVIVM
jgi:UDP-N-acetylmuramate dehydrogenase